MRVLLCLMLVAGALAHYRYYDLRDLIERDEMQAERGKLPEIVECPVCTSKHSNQFLARKEECTVAEGRSVKFCWHGTYRNSKCDNNWDCFRGPGERCTENMSDKPYLERCGRGLHCNAVLGVCTGIDYSVNSLQVNYVDPNVHYPVSEKLSPLDINYPIKAE